MHARTQMNTGMPHTPLTRTNCPAPWDQTNAYRPRSFDAFNHPINDLLSEWLFCLLEVDSQQKRRSSPPLGWSIRRPSDMGNNKRGIGHVLPKKFFQITKTESPPLSVCDHLPLSSVNADLAVREQWILELIHQSI